MFILLNLFICNFLLRSNELHGKSCTKKLVVLYRNPHVHYTSYFFWGNYILNGPYIDLLLSELHCYPWPLRVKENFDPIFCVFLISLKDFCDRCHGLFNILKEANELITYRKKSLVEIFYKRWINFVNRKLFID